MAETAPDKTADPQALQAKYTYPGAAQDDAIVQKVEAAIKSHFSDAYQSGLQESANNAPIKESEVQAKKADAESQAQQAAKDHPDEVKKEAQEAPPGKLDSGAAVQPQVKKASPPAGGPREPQKGAGQPAPKKPGPVGAPGKAGAEGAPHPSPGIVLAAASSGDGNIDKFLDDYPHKSHETTEQLSKVKEMAAVAKGFDSQIEGYVPKNSGALETAKAGVISFLGKKDVEAAFGENPYAKVQGGLGTLMRGLSRFEAIVSIVGNVCGKLGLVLTVVGLLGMIFPPLGAAVEAVARVLNVIGIICDVLGLALSGVLTGLNGVVLAKQIAKGASNEEKAATADMMVTEATSASGHVMSLAMNYGPKFMKGFKAESKGVIGGLFKKYGSMVGKFKAKALGPVTSWAKKVGYKLGFGLSKEPGLMSRVWTSPATLLEKARGSSLVQKINSSKFMQGLERGADRINTNRFITGVDEFGENAGKFAGGQDRDLFGWQGKLDRSADADVKATQKMVEQTGGQNAANRERATIDREITRKEKLGNTEYERSTAGGQGVRDESAAVRSNQAYDEAEALRSGRSDAVARAEKEGSQSAKEASEAKEAAEKTEDKRKDEFKHDPKGYRAVTQRYENVRDSMEERLKAPGLGEEQKAKLEAKVEQLNKTIDDRKLIPFKAGGGETPETLYAAYHQGKEALEHAHLKDKTGERLEGAKQYVENKSGHQDTEKFERAERHEKIEEWASEAGPAATVGDQVDGMLSGLDEDHDGQDPGHDAAGGGGGGAWGDAAGAEPSAAGHEPGGPSSGPAHEGLAARSEPAPAAPAGAAPGKGGEGGEGAEVPELIYWPKLVGPGGDFARATQDLARMKQIAIAFGKSQVEAKAKAMDTVATLAKSGEDAAKRQQHAQAHTASLHSTIDEARQAGASASKGTAQADEGSRQQNQGQSNSHGKTEQAPDPGPKPSLWHPIARIWWYVKKWASEAAAKVFGWIQDKIASLILEGLCGVSMGDMRAYTSALHNRMQYSQLVGTEGVAKANQAMGEQAKAKSESRSYADQAMDDAKECDQNMADADSFVKTIEATEKELAAEQVKAQQFLHELKAAVDAERRKQAEDKARAAAAAAGAAGARAASGASAAGASAAGAQALAPRAAAPRKPAVSPTEITKVTGAAGYVVSQANLVIQQLTTRQQQDSQRLKAALDHQPSRARSAVSSLKIGDGVIATTRSATGSIITAMDGVRHQTPDSVATLKGMAGQVKSQARQLDELATHAYQSLNLAFKSTYEAAVNMDKHA